MFHITTSLHILTHNCVRINNCYLSTRLQMIPHALKCKVTSKKEATVTTKCSHKAYYKNVALTSTFSVLPQSYSQALSDYMHI